MLAGWSLTWLQTSNDSQIASIDSPNKAIAQFRNSTHMLDGIKRWIAFDGKAFMENIDQHFILEVKGENRFLVMSLPDLSCDQCQFYCLPKEEKSLFIQCSSLPPSVIWRHCWGTEVTAVIQRPYPELVPTGLSNTSQIYEQTYREDRQHDIMMLYHT